PYVDTNYMTASPRSRLGPKACPPKPRVKRAPGEGGTAGPHSTASKPISGGTDELTVHGRGARAFNRNGLRGCASCGWLSAGTLPSHGVPRRPDGFTTRALTSFEESTLASFKSGRGIATGTDDSHTQFWCMGAVRAKNSCLECHQQQGRRPARRVHISIDRKEVAATTAHADAILAGGDAPARPARFLESHRGLPAPRRTDCPPLGEDSRSACSTRSGHARIFGLCICRGNRILAQEDTRDDPGGDGCPGDHHAGNGRPASRSRTWAGRSLDGRWIRGDCARGCRLAAYATSFRRPIAFPRHAGRRHRRGRIRD